MAAFTTFLYFFVYSCEQAGEKNNSCFRRLLSPLNLAWRSWESLYSILIWTKEPLKLLLSRVHHSLFESRLHFTLNFLKNLPGNFVVCGWRNLLSKGNSRMETIPIKSHLPDNRSNAMLIAFSTRYMRKEKYKQFTVMFLTYLMFHLCPVIRVPCHESVLGGFLCCPVRQTVNKQCE